MAIFAFFLLSIFLFNNQVNCLYELSKNVVLLNIQNFNNLVLQSQDVWLIEFYDNNCPTAQSFKEEYEKIANSLKGIAKVGAIDRYDALNQKYGIKEYPTLVIFGKNKSSPPMPYTGSKDAGSITDYIYSIAHPEKKRSMGKYASRSDIYHSNDKKDQNENDEGHVFTLTSTNFMKNVNKCTKVWFVLFCDPSYEICDSFGYDWKEAAAELKGEIHFGKINTHKENSLSERYKIEEIPSIKIFLPDESIYFPLDYEDPLTKQSVVEYAYTEILKKGKPKRKIRIIKIEDEDELNQKCKGKNKICLLLGIPMLEDGKSIKENPHLNNLIESIEPWKEKVTELFWIETKNQSEFLDTINHKNENPFILAVNSSSNSYSILADDLSKDQLNDFVNNVFLKKSKYIQIQEGLKISKGDALNKKKSETLNKKMESLIVKENL